MAREKDNMIRELLLMTWEGRMEGTVGITVGCRWGERDVIKG